MTPTDNAAGIPNAADPTDQSATETRFWFTVDGRCYDAWIEESAAGSRVCVSCPLGHMPYSAKNKAARKPVLMLLSAAGMLPMARLMLTNYQKVSLLVSEQIDDPVDPREIVGGAAAAGLKSNPLRNLMADCMMVQPG